MFVNLKKLHYLCAVISKIIDYEHCFTQQPMELLAEADAQIPIFKPQEFLDLLTQK